MKKYTTLLLDFDNTLLDFDTAERLAIKEAFAKIGYNLTPAMGERYNKINKGVWEEFEKGKWTKDEIVLLRFERMFSEYGVDFDPGEMNRIYIERLSTHSIPLPGALETLAALHGKYDIYVVSNGIAGVYESRLNLSGMKKYLKGSFVSETVGVGKPHKEYFDFVFGNIEEKDINKILIVGDSLTSDIQGGINAGLDTLWLSFGKKNDKNIIPTYEIRDITELASFLADITCQ